MKKLELRLLREKVKRKDIKEGFEDMLYDKKKPEGEAEE